MHLFEPAAVASGGSERAKVFLDDASPYRPLLDQMPAFRSMPVSVEEVADAVARSLDEDRLPLRIPVGAPAIAMLAARKSAPEDEPFLAAPIDW